MAKEISFEVKKEIGVFGENNTTIKRVRVASWNGREAKLDIRGYKKDGNNEIPQKGICLTVDEAKELIKLLNDYLNDEEDEDTDF